MPFLDLMKTARPWTGHAPRNWNGMNHDEIAGRGLLDAHGWPTAIPAGMQSIGTVWAWKGQPDAAASRQGDYVLRYDGTGRIRLGGDATLLDEEPGRIVFRNESGSSFTLDILATDPGGTGDYIRNISIVRQEYAELHEAGAIFNPEWLALIADSRQLRFMDWMETNDSTLSEWADRPGPGDATWTQSGVPLEAMVRLANETGADPWFTLPVDASEEYIREFATYVRDHLDPELKAIVELSNECWNPAFRQRRVLAERALAEWGVSDPAGYYVKAATGMARIWDEVFGAEAGTRLVKVLAGQGPNPSLTGKLLSAEGWFRAEPDRAVAPAEVFDAFAVAAYFGGKTVRDAGMRAELLAAIRDPAVDAQAWFAEKLMDPDYAQSIPQIAGLLQQQKALASRHGLDLVAYEGGQHVHHSFRVKDLPEEDLDTLRRFMPAFVHGERMAGLYAELWKVWQAVGDGPFMQFVDVSNDGKWGSWGLVTALGTATPRSERLFALNRATPAWWEEARGPHAFLQGVTRLGEGAGERLVGTAKRDYLIGSGGDDVLVGGAGNDGLHGGDGHDLVELDGSPDRYRVVAEGDGYRVTGPDGSDFVIGVEELAFSDGGRTGL
jgi:hypothetical protein